MLLCYAAMPSAPQPRAHRPAHGPAAAPPVGDSLPFLGVAGEHRQLAEVQQRLERASQGRYLGDDALSAASGR